MDLVCEEIKEDMHKMEEDSKKIGFNFTFIQMFYRFN